MINRRALLVSAASAAGLMTAPAWASDRFAPVVDRLRRFVDDGALPFAALRIARHGVVLAEAHVAGIEPVAAGSVYRLYSMTKPVVAAGVVLLVQDGRLTLETPVAELIPEFAGLTVLDADGQTVPARTMSVGHLLTHACGLANSWGGSRVAPLYQAEGLIAGSWMYDPAVGGLDGFARRLGALPLAFQPGTDWLYGYGLDIAGLVIERVSGRRLGAFLDERIFTPLGMTGAGFFAAEPGALTGLYQTAAGGPHRVEGGSQDLALRRPLADGGSAGLVSTLDDYGRFADMLAGGGARGGVRVMTEASARLLMSPWGPQAPLAAGLSRFFNGYDGFGQALGGVARLADDAGPGSAGEYGWGGAAGTSFWASPRLGLSVVVMTQLMRAGATPVREVLRPLIYQALAA